MDGQCCFLCAYFIEDDELCVFGKCKKAHYAFTQRDWGTNCKVFKDYLEEEE